MSSHSPTKHRHTDIRRLALDVLNQVERRRLTLDRILEETLSGHAGVHQRDKSLFFSLVWGVLRWRGRLDWIVKYFSSTPLGKIEGPVLNILRMGLFQIIHLDRIPASAAVNTSVNLTKQVSSPHVAKFVNALLRKASTEHSRVPMPDPKADPVLALAVEHAFPHWLVKRWIKRFGIDDTGLLCGAMNAIPPITLRTNIRKTRRSDLVRALVQYAKRVAPTSYADSGVRVFGLGRRPDSLDVFRKGWFQVQDEAAQLVTLLLDPRPGEKILDACAGLGGKTGHIAQQLNRLGQVTALDHSPRKLRRLEDEIERLGFGGVVHTQVHDLNCAFDPDSDNSYDRVLLDAPCSGLGVLRRNPDAKWSSQPKEVIRNRKRQLRFLNGLAPTVRPGGVLVYAVCSLEPEETDQVVGAFLKSQPEFVLDRPRDSFQGHGLLDEKGYLRTFPHRHDMDGFFAARLKKRSVGQ